MPQTFTTVDLEVAVYGPRCLFLTFTGKGFWRGHMTRVTGNDAEMIAAFARLGHWGDVWEILPSLGMGYLPPLPLTA